MSYTISAEELLVRFDRGERNFSGIELVSEERRIGRTHLADLIGVNLSGINLRGADLRKVDFTGSDLSSAQLMGAQLDSSQFTKCIFKKANLHSANLRWSGFVQADFSGAILNHINAISACFNQSILPAFEYAILADASFYMAKTSQQLLCRGGNLIWQTRMPDGTIVNGPQFGDGQGR